MPRARQVSHPNNFMTKQCTIQVAIVCTTLDSLGAVDRQIFAKPIQTYICKDRCVSAARVSWLGWRQSAVNVEGCDRRFYRSLIVPRGVGCGGGRPCCSRSERCFKQEMRLISR